MGAYNNFNGDFDGDYVNGNKFVYGCKPPPNDHPNARMCPQCWESTWKATRECVRCGCDVWHQDDLMSKQRQQKILKRRANISYACTGLSIILLVFSAYYLSGGFIIFFFLSSLFLLKLSTDLDQESK